VNGTVLCGVDDSDAGKRALSAAVELSRRLRLRLVVAHVIEVMRSADGAIDLDTDERFWRDRAGARAQLSELLEPHESAASPERRIAVGDVANRLAQIAVDEAADLIIVGATRPRRRRTRRRLPSMADRIATETPVSVLVAGSITARPV